MISATGTQCNHILLFSSISSIHPCRGQQRCQAPQAPHRTRARECKKMDELGRGRGTPLGARECRGGTGTSHILTAAARAGTLAEVDLFRQLAADWHSLTVKTRTMHSCLQLTHTHTHKLA